MKPKLLFINSSLNTGGAQSSMANFSLALAEKYDIDWLLNSDENIVYEYRGNIISLGIHEPENREALSYQLKAFIRRLKALKKLKGSGEYTAAISFLESANVANILTRRYGAKTIISQRNADFNKKGLFRNALRKVDKVLYKKTDVAVGISEGVRREFVRLYGIPAKKTVTILNGYDIFKIRDMAAQMPEDFEKPGAFTFITVGRLHSQKGQWHLIRAFAEIYSKEPSAGLVILGDGSDKEYLEKLIDSFKINRAVKMIPFKNNPFAIMSRCDAFVFPSLYEGFGNVLCEALICGLPVISSDYRYGAREILAPDTDIELEVTDTIDKVSYGILVPVCSGIRYEGKEPLEIQEELLAEAMCMLMSDKDVYNHYKESAAKRAGQISLESKCAEWTKILL